MRVTVAQPRRRSRRRCTCCRSSGRATPGPGRTEPDAPALRRAGPARSRPSTPSWRRCASSCDGRTELAVLRQRDQCARGCSACAGARAISRTASTTTSSTATRDAVNPAPPAPRRAAALHARLAGRRRGARSGCGSRPHRPRRLRRFRRDLRPAPRRGRRILRRLAARDRRPRRAPGPAPGLRRHAVVEAVLPLRCAALARRRPGASRRRPSSADTAATPTGGISTTPTSSRCRTNGNTPGMPPGTWRSTA